jgi:hypothetical protein
VFELNVDPEYGGLYIIVDPESPETDGDKHDDQYVPGTPYVLIVSFITLYFCPFTNITFLNGLIKLIKDLLLV